MANHIGNNPFKEYPIQTKPCAICKTPFETNHPNARYCKNETKKTIRKFLLSRPDYREHAKYIANRYNKLNRKRANMLMQRWRIKNREKYNAYKRDYYRRKHPKLEDHKITKRYPPNYPVPSDQLE